MLKLPNVTLICVEDTSEKDVFMASQIIKGIKNHIEFHDVKLLSSEIKHGVTHKIRPINSTDNYSFFILNDLIDYIDSEFVMIMQTDGYPLNPSCWSDKFLEYDYIGAPWSRVISRNEQYSVPMKPSPELVDLHLNASVGNGGLSIRSKKLIERVTNYNYDLSPIYWDKINITGAATEDEYICKYKRPELEAEGFTFAPVELAQFFSIENDVWAGQFGFHGKETIKLNKRIGHFNFDYHAYEKEVKVDENLFI